MNCRVKYHKLSSGDLKSTIMFNDKGVAYYSLISYEKGTWKILNANRRNVIRNGYSKNKNVLRRSARRELIKLGVKLGKEFKDSGYFKTKT